MIQTRSMFAIMLVLPVLFVGCQEQQKALDEIDLGTFSGSTYHNKYFGMTFNLPAGWDIQDQQSREELMELGGKVAAGNDENLKAAMEAAENTTVNLVTAFQHPVGSPVESNPGIICMAERVRHMPGIKNGKDYLFHAKNLIQQSAMQLSISPSTSTESLGGEQFEIMDVEMPVAGMTVRQKYYATVKKGYALVFVVTFMKAEEESVLQGIMNTLKFE